jgi:hypothetical protein
MKMAAEIQSRLDAKGFHPTRQNLRHQHNIHPEWLCKGKRRMFKTSGIVGNNFVRNCTRILVM